MSQLETAPPHLFIVFGGTGDLMRRKLLPALYRLVEQGLVDQSFRILSVARDEFDDGAYRQWARAALDEFVPEVETQKMSRWCDSCLNYFAIGKSTVSDFERLRSRIEEIEQDHDLPGNRAIYLALPPRVFPSTIERLGETGLNHSTGWTRIVVEKPFGRGPESAQALNRLVHQHFDENQVYRIDHYL
ncbi:MAG: glucose-6-phosphate dehydrogenase, partial [Rhodothermales bacterium]|nr:glucose-6-phosphate dehydrogenase [Rhodothermales bacterium]